MKTLLQAAIEFEAAHGGRRMPNWTETDGNPSMWTSSRDAFMAGAAAMAEIVANGQAVRVERSPGRYFLECEAHVHEPHKSIARIVWAYSMGEARKTLNLILLETKGLDSCDFRYSQCRPAVDSDTEWDKDIV